MRKLGGIAAIVVLGLLLAWVGVEWGLLSRAYATTKVTAVINMAGKQYEGHAVWRTTTKPRDGSLAGLMNYTMQMAGDAVTIRLDDQRYLFLRPYGGMILSCAAQEYRADANVAAALGKFRGPCSADAGEFILANLAASTPTFLRFWADAKGHLKDGDGGPASSETMNLLGAGFVLSSITVEATDMALNTEMTTTFPWILDLPRTDYNASGEYLGEESLLMSSGVTYAQFFTTYLPTPSGAFRHSLAY